LHEFLEHENKMKNTARLSIYTVTLILIFAFSCKTNNEKKELTENQTIQKTVYLVKVSEPSNGKLYSLGENIELLLKLYDSKIVPDSIIIYAGDKRLGRSNGLNYPIKTSEMSLGTLNIRAKAYKDGLFQTASVSVKLKSNIVPKKYSYQVIKTFPHDPDAYTQGLFYKDGFLYEGTGRNGSSSIRKVELETGKVLQSVNLDQKHFGEGIALFNNKIYQLTWTSEIGFKYDFNSFQQIGTFSYTTQGWGLTTDGNYLIMSDGSNTIHFIDPESFGEIKRIEVFDDKEPVNQLNELEYINGDIYANVYQTDKMVIINPKTGVVKGEINFKGLLKDSDKTNEVDVLNGVAWDETGKRLFVTGKLWPKLYQVVIVEK